MKKHIILLSAAGLLFSSCGVYTKYKPATEVPDGLYGEEMAAFTESLAGSPAATEDSLDLGLGGMDWHELFTDPHLQALIGQGLQNNTDYQSAQLRVEEAEATLLSAKLAFLPSFALAPQGMVARGTDNDGQMRAFVVSEDRMKEAFALLKSLPA